MKTVAVLCVGKKSIYYMIPGLDVYGKERDAGSYIGNGPVLAHPPCRGWSVHCSHQAKPESGEKELGLWCAELVKRNGGILEQPAHSRLWQAANLPVPNWKTNPTSPPWQWSIEVCQAWWGYPMLKRTWLFLSGIRPEHVRLPIKLHPQGFDRRREQLMSKSQRSYTVPEFAAWLVDLARHTETLSRH